MMACLIMPLLAGAQDLMQICGHITDNETNTPLVQVNISIQGKSSGTSTDKNGDFCIDVPKSGCHLRISHIGYASNTIRIEPNSNEPLNITLQSVPFTLKPFEVQSEAVVCVTKDEPYYITDYEIVNGNILLSVFRNRMISKSQLVLINQFGDLLMQSDIWKSSGLYKSPDNNLYYSSGGVSFQIYMDSLGFYFSDPIEKELLDFAQEHLVDVYGDSIWLRSYYYRNQGMSYFVYDRMTDTTVEQLVYMDDEAVDRMKWGGYFDGSEFDQRFEELIVYKPIQVPLFICNDSLYIFNFVNKQLEVRSVGGDIKRVVPLPFCESKGWEPEVYFDPVQKKFYTRFYLRNQNSFQEVNIFDGSLGNSVSVPGYPFMEKIAIYDNTIYFLYKEYAGDEYKRLYKRPLYWKN